MTYAEPFLSKWLKDLDEDQQQEYLELKEKYDEFGWLIMISTSYHRMLSNEPITALSIVDRLPQNSNLLKTLPEKLLNAKSYREFLEDSTLYEKRPFVASANYAILFNSNCSNRSLCSLALAKVSPLNEC